jgi:hypothetical protein
LFVSTFENRAVGVLNECYKKNKKFTYHLLVRKLKLWGETTLLSISDRAEQMVFMGHSACQTKLNKIGKGKMAFHTQLWKIILSMFLPFFVFSMKFHNDPVGRDDDMVSHL